MTSGICSMSREATYGFRFMQTALNRRVGGSGVEVGARAYFENDYIPFR